MYRAMIVIIFLIAGCSNTPGYEYSPDEEDRLEAALFKELAPRESILVLTPEIQQFLDSNINRRWPQERRIYELRELFFNPEIRGITYAAEATYPAWKSDR